MAKIRKKKTPKVRVFIGDKEAAALLFLRNFPDFADKSPSAIIKICLMIVAVDARAKLDEAKKQYEDTNNNNNDDDGAAELRDGADSSGENNKRNSQAKRGKKEGKG